MSQFSLLAVFLVGLLGAVHCLGMCGSIVGALTYQMPNDRPRWPFHLAYSAGRIFSYGVAGALVGGIGQAGMLARDVAPVQHLLFGLSNLMLVVLGLYLAGLWDVARRLEHAGAWIWRRIQPYAGRFLPIRRLPQALAVGALWGWLPCGMVYSVLIVALASASPQRGAIVMLVFGVGTLPGILLIGLFWERCRAWILERRIRLIAGLLVVAMGGYGLFHVGNTFARHGWYGSCHVPVG